MSVDISTDSVLRMISRIYVSSREEFEEEATDMLSALRSALTCCEEERRLGQEELRKLRADIEAMRTVLDLLHERLPDAERYRWLRDRLFAIDFTYTEENLSVLVFHAPPSPIGAGSSLDAAIDAAREGKNDAAK